MLSIIAPKLVRLKAGPLGVYYWIKPYTVKMLLTSNQPFFSERAMADMVKSAGILGGIFRPFLRGKIQNAVNEMIIECLPDANTGASKSDKTESKSDIQAMAEMLPRAVISTSLPVSEMLEMTYLDLIWFARVGEQVRVEDKLAAIAAGSGKPQNIPDLPLDKRYSKKISEEKIAMSDDLFVKMQIAALQAGSNSVH